MSIKRKFKIKLEVGTCIGYVRRMRLVKDEVISSKEKLTDEELSFLATHYGHEKANQISATPFFIVE